LVKSTTKTDEHSKQNTENQERHRIPQTAAEHESVTQGHHLFFPCRLPFPSLSFACSVKRKKETTKAKKHLGADVEIETEFLSCAAREKCAAGKIEAEPKGALGRFATLEDWRGVKAAKLEVGGSTVDKTRRPIFEP